MGRCSACQRGVPQGRARRGPVFRADINFARRFYAPYRLNTLRAYYRPFAFRQDMLRQRREQAPYRQMTKKRFVRK